MVTYLSATPAYGRDYRSAKAVREDWDAGKDFQIQPSGQYINKSDKPAGVILNIRYAKLTKVAVIR